MGDIHIQQNTSVELVMAFAASAESRITAKVLIVGLVWFATSLALGALGVIASLHPPFPQAILVGLTSILLLLFGKAPAFRAWVMSLPLPALLLPHLSRFVGFYFLALHARGELPYAFAVPGGCGDIAAAAGALFLMCVPPQKAWRPTVYLIWNIFGLADILFVIVTAARLALSDPDSMRAILHLPLSLLPTFFVPLIVASHLILFIRLRRTTGAPVHH